MENGLDKINEFGFLSLTLEDIAKRRDECNNNEEGHKNPVQVRELDDTIIYKCNYCGVAYSIKNKPYSPGKQVFGKF